jgi:pimeloyl-ACP methyl ester carboxylesterase
VLALHGIFTGGAKVNWTEDFAAWSIAHMPDHVVWTQNYFRLALPRWNWIPNWFRARKLAKWLGSLMREGYALHVIGHSNGASIALQLLKMLANQGLKVDSALFIGGAISCDIKRSGIQHLIGSGRLGRACAWWSKADRMIGLPGILLWPYGKLGVRGFRQKMVSVDGIKREISVDGEFLKSVVHAGFSHSGYFEGARVAVTFQKMAEWVGGERLKAETLKAETGRLG